MLIELDSLLMILPRFGHCVSGQSWSYGSWICSYLCNQWLSQLKLWFRIPLIARCTRYNIMWYSLSVTWD